MAARINDLERQIRFAGRIVLPTESDPAAGAVTVCGPDQSPVVQRTDGSISIKPDTDGWIEWNGGECPIPGELVVETRFRGRITETERADRFRWWHATQDSVQADYDIIAYRLRKPEPTGIDSEGGSHD